jgi:hypothetical protein
VSSPEIFVAYDEVMDPLLKKSMCQKSSTDVVDVYEPFLSPNYNVVEYIQDKLDKPAGLGEPISELEEAIKSKVCPQTLFILTFVRSSCLNTNFWNKQSIFLFSPKTSIH